MECFVKNRLKLMSNFGENCAVVLYSGALKQESADESYPFVPNMNFYYLTGIKQDNTYLIIEKSKKGLKSTLYVYDNDPVLARWIGSYLTHEEAQDISSVEEVKSIKDFDKDFTSTIKNYATIGIDLEKSEFFGQFDFGEALKNKALSIKKKCDIVNVYPLLTKIRAKKEPYEIEAIKNSIHVTRLALDKVMQQLPDLNTECEVQALFESEIKKIANANTAFNTIAAGGPNATVLHYHENQDKLDSRSTILLDLGAEVNLYNADISRTYPCNGKYGKLQKLIYNIVLYVNELIIDTIKPGVSLIDLQKRTIDALGELCLTNNLIKNKDEINNYYIHHISHHLGLDTHDPCGRDTVLEEGMVITVEPGLYFDNLGIGVRIEDDVLVTATGSQNLSKEIIKDPDEIEKYMAKFRKANKIIKS